MFPRRVWRLGLGVPWFCERWLPGGRAAPLPLRCGLSWRPCCTGCCWALDAACCLQGGVFGFFVFVCLCFCLCLSLFVFFCLCLSLFCLCFLSLFLSCFVFLFALLLFFFCLLLPWWCYTVWWCEQCAEAARDFRRLKTGGGEWGGKKKGPPPPAPATPAARPTAPGGTRRDPQDGGGIFGQHSPWEISQEPVPPPLVPPSPPHNQRLLKNERENKKPRAPPLALTPTGDARNEPPYKPWGWELGGFFPLGHGRGGGHGERRDEGGAVRAVPGPAGITLAAQVGVGVVPRVLVVLEDVEARGLRTEGQGGGQKRPWGGPGGVGEGLGGPDLGVLDLQRAAPRVDVGPVEGRLGALRALHRVERGGR